MSNQYPYLHIFRGTHDSDQRPTYSLLTLLLIMTVIGPVVHVASDFSRDFFVFTGLIVSYVSSAAFSAWLLSFLKPGTVLMFLLATIPAFFFTALMFGYARVRVELDTFSPLVPFLALAFDIWLLVTSLCAFGLSWSRRA